MIVINFATGNFRLIQRIRLGLYAGSIFLIAVIAVLVWFSLSMKQQMALVAEDIRRIETSDQDILPILSERDRLVKDLNSMSGLIDARRFSWTRLLSRIESVVPIGTALVKVELNAKSRQLSLEGSAQSPEALRNLIVAMEKAPVFRDPLLKHQTVEKGSISFNVVAVYTEDAGAVMAETK